MIDKILADVKKELLEAQKNNGPMYNSHHGYSVILEELDELWDEVKTNPKKNSLRQENMRKEAIQVAAMAIRFLHDVCDCNPVTVEMFEPPKRDRVVRRLTYQGESIWLNTCKKHSLRIGINHFGKGYIIVKDIEVYFFSNTLVQMWCRELEYVGDQDWVKSTIAKALPLGFTEFGMGNSIVIKDITMGDRVKEQRERFNAEFGKL